MHPTNRPTSLSLGRRSDHRVIDERSGWVRIRMRIRARQIQNIDRVPRRVAPSRDTQASAGFKVIVRNHR